MVRASVPARACRGADSVVFRNERAKVRRKRRVGAVGDERDGGRLVRRRVRFEAPATSVLHTDREELERTGHVQLDLRADRRRGASVAGCDGARTQETSLFASVPMEMNWHARGIAALDESTESLDEGNATTAIVISTWGASGRSAADGVQMRAEDDDGRCGVCASERRNDRLLRE